MNNHDESKYDALAASNWRNKDFQDARAQMNGMGTGMVDKNSASLMGVHLGKEHQTQFASEAAERMTSDEVIMQGRMVVEEFYKELMIQAESISAAELHIAYQATQPAVAPEQAKNLATDQAANGAELATGIGLAFAGVVRAFNEYCDEHKVSPRARKAGLVTFTTLFILACGLPSIGGILETAKPPLETLAAPVVAQVGTLVEEDASNAGAQQPSATAEATKKPTSTPRPATETPATATETAAALTPRQQEFLDQGLDKLSSLETGVIYGILDESTVKYMPDGGAEIVESEQTGYALSTAELTYYNPETKQFERNRFVLDWSVPTGFDDGSFATYPVDGGTAGISPDVIPQAVLKNHRKQYFDFTPEKNPFVKIVFDYKVPGWDPVNKFLSAAFPEFKGKIKVVDLPGLGKVLVVKGVVPEGYPGW